MKVSLYYQQGPSDKVYHIQLEKAEGGYVVNFQYGRRGSALKSGTKTESSVSLECAKKVYEKLLNEKLGKGYSEGANTSSPTGQVFTKKEATANLLPQLLNPIDDPEYYIENDDYLAQEKIDGERRIVAYDSIIEQYNRKGQLIPTVTDLESCFKYKCTVDGEMVGEEFFVFDLLSFQGKDIRDTKCSMRMSLLNSFSFNKGITIVGTAYTKEEKRKLFEQLKKDNKEGIVFKRKDSVYTAGRPSSGGDQLKFKFYKTATFIVANTTKGKRSVGLELFDGKEKVFMGKVTIPPNHEVPKIGTLVEVRYLYAYKGGAVYQPTYLGPRTDLDLKDASLKQIVYKQGETEE